MRYLTIVVLVAGSVAECAEPRVDPREKMRQAMEASIARQRASVQRQKTAVAAQQEEAVPSAAAPVEDAGDCEPVSREEVGKIIRETADREGMTPDLLRAVISKESAFNPCAISRKGAQGLMQLMPATAAHFQVTNPFNARQNIDAGTKLLKQLLTRYNGDLSLALGAYNAGPGRVDKAGGIPLIPETVNYVSDILDSLGQKRLE